MGLPSRRQDAEKRRRTRHSRLAQQRVGLSGRRVLRTAEELGSLERGAAVSPGRHRIEVLAPGHAPRALEVDVQAGERRQVSWNSRGD